MTHPDKSKLLALLPLLESWTGGERRDIDVRIAKAVGWTGIHNEPGYDAPIGYAPDGGASEIPNYLGTSLTIATEDMQRLVMERGAEWAKIVNDTAGNIFWVFRKDVDEYGHPANSLPLAWVRAEIARSETP